MISLTMKLPAKLLSSETSQKVSVSMSRFSSRLSEISEASDQSGFLTWSDRYKLKQALLSTTLEERDRQIIDRLLHSFCQGTLKLEPSKRL